MGYKHYADDVVVDFIKKAVAHGMDIFRIFDAMNDVKNMSKAMETATKEGAHVQATISYTTSAVHNLDYFLKMAGELVNEGADSFCIKDMAGILNPYDAFTLVSSLRKRFGLPVQLHTHYTSGMGSAMYVKAVEGGATVIDTAISSLALGTSQPAAETMVSIFKGTAYDTNLDLAALAEIAEYFKEIRKKYQEYDVYSGGIDPNVLIYQVPGGMLSNFISQLQQQNALDKLPEVLVEVPRVREDLGYPPLVTPTSQIVGSQAVLNVLLGRYKMVTNEVKAYMRGLYGATPGPVNEEIRKTIIGEEQPITGRPADYIEPQLEQARKEIGNYIQKNEDVLSYVLFPEVAKKFLEERYVLETNVDYNLACNLARDAGNNIYPL